MHRLNQLTAQDIQQRLRRCAEPVYDIPTGEDCIHYREAGVLIPLTRIDEQWHIIYIRRPASDMDMHSGQVAFAGGKRDPEDSDLIKTALRESYEEIGLLPQDVTVLGQLSAHHSISRFRITPTVGIIPWPYNLCPNPTEVARIFTIPLQWLATTNQYHIHYRQLPNIRDPVPVVYFQHYDGELLWGTTARITLALLTCLQV